MGKIQVKKVVFGVFFSGLLYFLALTSCCIIDPYDHVSNTNYSATEPFSFEIPVKNQSRIVVEAANGPIDVTGVPEASSVQIWGERRVESESQADAQAHLKELEIRVSDSEDQVFVKTVQPHNTHGQNYQVTYHILIPIDWDVSIANGNGKVIIDSLNADVCVDLGNGDVHLGEIVGSVSVTLGNGDVESKLTLPIQGICQISIGNGQIQLAIPTNTSAEFSATVGNGSVSVSELQLQNVTSSQNHIKGTLGDGEGTITLEVGNGSISVKGF